MSQNQKKVHLICTSCAEHNGATWRNDSSVATVLLGKCHVCNEVKPITNIYYWAGIHSEMALQAPKKPVATASVSTAGIEDVVPKVAKTAKETAKIAKEAAKTDILA